ncbi:MAG: hypothetical protein QHH14_08040 [Clostridiales bacterium]|nr:hypothetical protein [Clostridiales bacterium]
MKIKIRWREIVFGLIFFLLLGFHIYWLSYGPHEDSYISFRFSKHLAAGHGLRWNLDEPPIEGYTNFLWVLIGAVVALIFPQGLPQIMPWVGIPFLLATALIFKKMISWSHQENKYSSWLFVLFFAASGPLAYWSASGMETSLYTFLVLACFYSLQRHLASGEEKFYRYVWLISFLAFLTRPDGILLAFILALYFLVFKKGIWKKERLLPFTLYFLVPFLLYNTWRIAYFSSLLPNTFYAKATGAFLLQLKKGLFYIKDFSLTYLVSLLPLAAYLAIKRGKKTFGLNPFSSLTLLFLVLSTLSIVVLGGDYMAMYRFFAPLLPLIYLLLSLLFLDVASSRRANMSVAWMLFALVLIGTMLPSTPLEKFIWGSNKPYHNGCYEGIKTERWWVNRFITIGKLFRRIRKSPSDTLVIPGIGAVSYYSEMNIIDYHGLTDRHIARLKVKTFGESLAGHEKTDIDYILSRKATFLMGYKRFSPVTVTADHHQFEASYVQGDPQRRKFIQENYQVKNVWVEDRINGENGYIAYLELKQQK